MVDELELFDKTAAAKREHAMHGQLRFSRSGYLQLHVPNALGRGVFDTLQEPGVELPVSETTGQYNAHVTVLHPHEVDAIGADRIHERGGSFAYSIGKLYSVEPKDWKDVSKVWCLEVVSPDLTQLRRTYGLSSLPQNADGETIPFHITVGIRRKGVLGSNPVARVQPKVEEPKAMHDVADGESKQVKIANEDNAPYRERAEVFAIDPATKRIYGGRWDNDKSFALPGGGIDPGEDIATGALRELYEETGMRAKNPRIADVPPIISAWSDKHRATLPPDRQHFQGTRTHFVMADLESTEPEQKELDHWGATDRRLYDIAEALEVMNSGLSPQAPAVWAARKQLLEMLRPATPTVKFGSAITKALVREGKKVNTSPTPAQAEAGNYRKGHVKMHGLDISIENPKGSVRSGTSKDGKKWSITMKADYGYIRGTIDKDGDQVDCFVGEHPDTELVFVVDQLRQEDGVFDEHKVVFGCQTAEDAKSLYMANYSKGWKGFGGITGLTVSQFKEWLKDGNTTKPIAACAFQLKTAAAVGLILSHASTVRLVMPS